MRCAMWKTRPGGGPFMECGGPGYISRESVLIDLLEAGSISATADETLYKTV